METTHHAADAALSGTAMLIAFAIGLSVYIFFCFCLKQICQKCGVETGILIWLPLFQLIPLLQAAGLPGWSIILFLVPILNIIMGLVLWVKLCGARGKGVPAILLTIFIPVIGIPYLAFSE